MSKEERFDELIRKFNNEEEEPLVTEPKRKTPDFRYNMLYEKAKIKNEMIKIIYEKNNELKIQQELTECTFKPKIISKKKDEKVFQLNQCKDNLYIRNMHWNRQKKEK
jgi:hypothetical protein